MILGIAFLLLFFVAVPAYFALHSRARLPWGGERELCGITLALSVALGAWVLGWDGTAMLERSTVPQLEAFQQVRESPALCANLWRYSLLLLVQSVPLCAGGSALYLPGLITVISWLVFLAAAWVAGCAVAGPLAGVGALLVLLALPLVREPFLALGPEPLWLAGAAVVMSALIIARSRSQVVICVALVTSAAAVALVAPLPVGHQAAGDVHTALVPLVAGAMLGGYLLRFFTRNLRRSYVDLVALSRLVLLGATVAVTSLVTASHNGLPTLPFGTLVLVAAVGCGAVMGGLGRFLGIHPVAAPVTVVCAALCAVFVSLPQHQVPSGVVSLASDLVAVAPSGAVIGTTISPGVLRDFVSTREIVSYSELALRGGRGAAAAAPLFVETRFATSEQIQELRSKVEIEPVLPGIYRVLPLAATMAQ